jgi:hypothetical protein
MRRASTVVLLALAAAVVSEEPSARSGAALQTEPGISITFLPATAAAVGRPTLMPIRIANTTRGTAVGVTLTVQTPAWVKLAGPRCARRRASLVCPIPDLAPGTGVTLRLQVTPTRLSPYRIQARAIVKALESGDGSAAVRFLAAGARFRGVILPISPSLARRMTGVSWRQGCPVGLGDLRALRLAYWDFGGRVRTGTLIVNRDAAEGLLRVFARLYAARYPIRRVTPVDAYDGDDYRSIEADNTSAFNCRPVAGTGRWSEHAYGRAVDLNPLENPYVSGGATSHPGSRRYLDRSLRLPGMIHAGDVVVRAFAAAGWGWGGGWSGIRDYQHFSASGR